MTLILRTGDGQHEMHCPPEACFDIGSSPECEVVLEGADVLPQHATLSRIGEKRFRITRSVPDARFTVNDVSGGELEVETPFWLALAEARILFDLISEDVRDPEAEQAEQKTDAENPTPARVNRREYLLKPAMLRLRNREHVASSQIEQVPEPPTPLLPSPTDSTEAKTPPTTPEVEAKNESSPLLFAVLLLCGLMVVGIFLWQQVLDRDTAKTPAAEQTHTLQVVGDAQLLDTARQLRMAHAAALAEVLLLPQAESGDVNAKFELALALREEGGFEDEAITLLRQTAEQGLREALPYLVEMVDAPTHQARHRAESLRHLEFAARLGESSAWMPLGERLEHGHGTPRDLTRALAAYTSAHQAGDRLAEGKLAAKQEALNRAAAFVRSWNDVSVAALLEHVSSTAQSYFGQEKPTVEAMLHTEELLRTLWPLRRVNLAEGVETELQSFERAEVRQPYRFELQRGARVARGSGLFVCEVKREDVGWRVVSARDEIALKELLPSAAQFSNTESLRQLRPAFSAEEQKEEARLDMLEMLRGIEETQDFKPALTLILEKAKTFPADAFWLPFADRLCDRMARVLFAQGHWLDAGWSEQVHQLAGLGSVSALLLEGHLRMAGYGFAKDAKRGFALYEQAFAKGKRRDARFYYAEALFQGRGTAQDIDQANALVLSFMTHSKHPLEAYLAAHLLWRKAEIDPSLWQQVYDTLARVAEKHPPARHLAAMVLLNHGNTTRERRTGFAALKAAAEAGVPEAMRNLSKCYQDGIGCEKDLQAATLWKQKAAVVEPLKRKHYTEFGE